MESRLQCCIILGSQGTEGKDTWTEVPSQSQAEVGFFSKPASSKFQDQPGIWEGGLCISKAPDPDSRLQDVHSSKENKTVSPCV